MSRIPPSTNNTEGLQDIQNFLNDPNNVPLGVNPEGDIFITDDGTYLIVSSTLRVRGPRVSAYRRKKRWLLEST